MKSRLVARFGGLMVIGAALLLLAWSAAAPAAAPSTASNELAAQRDAQRLLRRVVLPSGAIRVAAEPKGDGGVLSSPGGYPAVLDLVDVHAFWRVRSRLGSVLAFVKRHVPRGGLWSGAGSSGGPGIPPNRQLMFSFPAVMGRIGPAWMNVTAVALPGGSTGVRVDAQVSPWVRSSGEQVPAGVHTIDIKSLPRVSLRVSNPAKVEQIIRWIDALEIVQPGTYSCPFAPHGPTVTFDFRGVGGVALANASVTGSPSGPCNPIDFSVHGQAETPLIGANFLMQVSGLLGVRFN